MFDFLAELLPDPSKFVPRDGELEKAAMRRRHADVQAEYNTVTSVAKRLGLPIVVKFVTAAVVGVPPRIMGVGPAYAIPKILEKVGLSKDEVDFYEINEAFTSQAVYSIEKIGLSYEKVNLNGGAIAIEHPLGCSQCSRHTAVKQPADILRQLVHDRLQQVLILRSKWAGRSL
jgi:acetyl-CoA acetyltransferase